jgi:nifR3 family TIM-barrel protein
MKFGNLELKHGLMLAPMAGYSDRAMRCVCHRCGCEYAVTEMVSAKAVVYRDEKTAKLAGIRADEGPVALQIFGSEPSVLSEAAAILEPGRGEGFVAPVAIDINMGCPVPKIFNNGDGSALMKNPALIHDIVKAVTGSVKLPVTVKLRLGIDSKHLNAVECALAAEEGGAALITVHGRTRVQMYAGVADREGIANVKSALHIPVVANGDVTDAESALSMLRETGCDGIAIGRGAVGNPFVFSQIAAALEGREYEIPFLDTRVHTALEQLSIASLDKGERVAVPEARKQIALYLRGFRGSASIRAQINAADSYSEVEKILKAALTNEFS